MLGRHIGGRKTFKLWRENWTAAGRALSTFNGKRNTQLGHEMEVFEGLGVRFLGTQSQLEPPTRPNWAGRFKLGRPMRGLGGGRRP
jgi:hypothetical protein